MIDKNKQDESIRQSGYLAAVFPTKSSSNNLISKIYLQQSKRMQNRSYKLLDTRSRTYRSDMPDNQPSKKSKSFKKYIKIRRQIKSCIQQMKITPFQNRKIQQKQTSQKKLAVANKIKDAATQLYQSKQKWLIVQQAEISNTAESAKKLLMQQIKRIKCGIQNMRQQIQAENLTDKTLSNLDNKNITRFNFKQKEIKQTIKKNIFRGSIHQDYSQKIKTHLIKQINKKSQQNKLGNLCVFSHKYILRDSTSNDKSLKLVTNSSLQTQQYKSFKSRKCSSINKPQMGVYLNNGRITKNRQRPWLQKFIRNSCQIGLDQQKKLLRERELQKVIGWQGANRQNVQKQIYP